MKIEKNIISEYKWDFDKMGLFKASFCDDKLTRISFCKDGSCFDGNCLNTDSIEFARFVHKALGELFEKIDKDK